MQSHIIYTCTSTIFTRIARTNIMKNLIMHMASPKEDK